MYGCQRRVGQQSRHCAQRADALSPARSSDRRAKPLSTRPRGLLQIDRQVYGDPPNINREFSKGGGDGKTHFLICDIQEGWSGTGSYVAGFFYSVDVDPNTAALSITATVRDMLYIDSYPGLYFNGRRRTSTGPLDARPRISAPDPLELRSLR